MLPRGRGGPRMAARGVVARSRVRNAALQCECAVSGTGTRVAASAVAVREEDGLRWPRSLLTITLPAHAAPLAEPREAKLRACGLRCMGPTDLS